ncbi:unnamed protein product [Prorocentrum cordatum]|uniref:Uncharacterized protein n=1 Tax=Prorocentrum cordatum TaxID=2364126 RepID=A0ABN9YFM2_9DINO|nr:unnamed protein product [Polarella glacialis]
MATWPLGLRPHGRLRRAAGGAESPQASPSTSCKLRPPAPARRCCTSTSQGFWSQRSYRVTVAELQAAKVYNQTRSEAAARKHATKELPVLLDRASAPMRREPKRVAHSQSRPRHRQRKSHKTYPLMSRLQANHPNTASTGELQTISGHSFFDAAARRGAALLLAPAVRAQGL